VLVAAVGQSAGEIESFLQPLHDTPVEIGEILVSSRAYLSERKEVETLCRRWDAGVLHTHGYRPDVVDGVMGRKLGIGPVTTVHGFTGGGRRNRLYEWLQCQAYRRFAAVVAVSHALRDTLLGRGVPESRLHVVRNALAPPTFLPADEARAKLAVPPSSFHIGWIGRLSPEKGPDVFLEGLSRLRSMEGIRVSVVGEGPLRTLLEERTRDRGLQESVRFLGSLENAPGFFPAFDLIVLSSRTEGTPMVLLEAMAAGVPVVATRVGGIPDMVSDKEAWLVPPDHPAALAEAVAEVRSHPVRARKRGESAQGRFREEYGLLDWVRAYDQVYGTALDGKSPSSAAG